LHERNLRACVFHAAKAKSEFLDLVERRNALAHLAEQALDNDGTLARGGDDVRGDLLDRDSSRMVDAFELALRSGIELGPDFVAGREKAKAVLDLRIRQAGGVGDENDFEEWKAAAGANVDDCFDGFEKFGADGWFAIAAERHVAEPKKIARQTVVGREQTEVVVIDEAKEAFQFGGSGVAIEVEVMNRLRAIDLAIDAIEIAFAIRVDIDSNREAAGARGDR
jgi:hypothetical protein